MKHRIRIYEKRWLSGIPEPGNDHYKDDRNLPGNPFEIISKEKVNKKEPEKYPFVVPWQMYND